MLRHHLLALAAIACGCSSLPPAEPGVCGNRVVEPDLGEDCDRPGADCGAPGTALECRRLCATTTECPATAVCGDDGACHVPDGVFTPHDAQPFTAAFVLIGDVDGSGDVDLVGVDDIRVDIRLGQPGPTFAATAPIPNLPPVAEPRLADVTGDGRADLIASIGAGINLTIGDPGTLLAPTLQKTIALDARPPVRTAVIRTAAAGGTLVVNPLALTVGNGVVPGCGAGCAVLLVDSDGVRLPIGRDLTFVDAPRIPWGWLPSPDGNTQVAAALAFRDDDARPGDQSVIDVFRIQVVPHALLPRVELLQSITSGLGSARAAHFADVDGDGVDDLVATLDTGGQPRLAIGRGNGAGFAPLLAMVTPGDGGTMVSPPAPLTWADVDDDGRRELVTDTAVYAVGCTPELGRWSCALDPLLSTTSGWSAVQVGDVNGDHRSDVVAIRAGSTTVDVYLGTDTAAVWNRAPFVNGSKLDDVRIGDFDGNGVGDLALLAVPADEGDGLDLMVAFGQLGGRPGPPVRMGAIERPVAVEVSRGTGGLEPDAIDDLMTFSADPGELRISFVVGSTSQRMASPLVPRAEPGLDPFDLVGTLYPAALPISAGTSPGVIAALATTLRADPDAPFGFRIERNSLRYLFVDAGGRMTEEYGGVLAIPDFEPVFAHWTAIAGVDESHLAGLDPSGRLVIATVRGCPAACAVAGATIVDAGASGAPVRLSALDLDRTGRPELIGAFAGDVSELVVWRDAGASGEHIPLPAGVEPVSVTALETTIGAPRTLVIAARELGLFVARPDAGGRYGEVVSAVDAGLVPVDDRAAVGVHAADVDDDGLDDLIVTSGPAVDRPRAVTIYTQGRVPGGAGLAAGEGR